MAEVNNYLGFGLSAKAFEMAAALPLPDFDEKKGAAANGAGAGAAEDTYVSPIEDDEVENEYDLAPPFILAETTGFDFHLMDKVTRTVAMTLDGLREHFQANPKQLRASMPMDFTRSGKHPQRAFTLIVTRDLKQVYLQHDATCILFDTAYKQVLECTDLRQAKKVVVLWPKPSEVLRNIPTNDDQKGAAKPKMTCRWELERNAIMHFGKTHPKQFPEVYGTLPMPESAKRGAFIEEALVQERCQMDLLTLWEELSSKGKWLSENRKLHLAQNIALAIAAMHGEGYAHRDIKPENVLLDKNNDFKLTDLGLCLAPSGIEIATTPGTPSFWSPELWGYLEHLFNPDSVPGRRIGIVEYQRADIWAYGLLVLFGETGGCIGHIAQIVDVIAKKEKTADEIWDASALVRKLIDLKPADIAELQNHIMSNCKNSRRTRLILGCLNPNPEKRFTIHDVLRELGLSRLVVQTPVPQRSPAASPASREGSVAPGEKFEFPTFAAAAAAARGAPDATPSPEIAALQGLRLDPTPSPNDSPVTPRTPPGPTPSPQVGTMPSADPTPSPHPKTPPARSPVEEPDSPLDVFSVGTPPDDE